MKPSILMILMLLISCKDSNLSTVSDSGSVDKKQAPYAIVIHGGAGTIKKENMTPEAEKAYTDKLDEALTKGEHILKNGGSALEAVQATINIMEDSPLFNAGKGAVFTYEGTNELDASIMEGKTQKAGAVAGVKTIKNPIDAAIKVMNNSKHVMMAGKGAEEFASLQGLEIVEPNYFYTERRMKSLEKIKISKETELSESDAMNKKHGTVGCVALDNQGNIVAGTSTGGMTNKRFGRVGDAPIIGAGTFADNTTCGVSATGHGEFFIRYTVARDIAALMEYGGKSLQEASHYIIHEKLVDKGGTGGIIALDRYGNIAMPFNTSGMYRGYAKPGEKEILIYANQGKY